MIDRSQAHDPAEVKPVVISISIHILYIHTPHQLHL